MQTPQLSGHAQGGLDWNAYIDALVAIRGSLTALAEQLCLQRDFAEEVGSAERGLRRLRDRGRQDGGVWGQRVIAVFGLPRALEDRMRWMGHYHSRFTDLPTSVCAELLAGYDHPPVSASRARIWLQLGHASVALRLRQYERATHHLNQAKRVVHGNDAAAKAELELVLAYACSREQREQSDALLDQATTTLECAGINADDHACLFARLVDQRAYPLNRAPSGETDHEGALALYQSIPDDGPPFACCRRESGLGWTLLKLGRTEQALHHARASVSRAGDSGSLRLRAMALNLLATALGPKQGAAAKARVAAIAKALEDEELRARYTVRG